ncbi:MAG TPA: COQ9 family protein [Stellaceae bacterium]|nr:COQ9 family protein [Stellaceae bacterium]
MEEHEKRRVLIEAMLPEVPFDGWSRTALRAAAAETGIDESEALTFFRTPRDLVQGFSHWADDRMLDALLAQNLDAMRVRDRVAAAERARLRVLEPHREAVRRALAVLALPQNMAMGLILLYRTVDAIWYAAGDRSTDFNFYTKRGLLAGVHAATTLYWLDDRSEGGADTSDFLDRRLAEVMSIPKLRARLEESLAWLPNPFRLMRAARRP